MSLNPDGTFSWTGAVTTERSCELRAVPNNWGNNYPLSPFAGAASQLDYLEQDWTSTGTASSGPFYDYYYSGADTGAYDDYDSVGDCGLDYSSAMQAPQSYASQGTWACSDALYASDGTQTQRSEIQIDGKNAYDSYQAENAFAGSDTETGFPALTSSYVKDPSTENVTIDEAEPFVSCPGGAYPASSSNCPSWDSDGVTFSRAISETDDGQLVTISDTYKSTDGAAHSLDLQYDNYGYESDEPVLAFPGSSYQTYGAGDQASLSGKSEDAIYVADGYFPLGSLEDGVGSLIYTTQPNYALFTYPGEFVLDYQRTVPAGGSITITQDYVTAASQTATQKITNGILDQVYKPAVTITSPANGTIMDQSSAQVSGTASAHDGLTLRVDGEAVGVNSDGTWSTAVSLNKGSNTITAVASDGSGNTTQASETVVYSPTLTAQRKFCIVPHVGNDKLNKAKAALKNAGCEVGKIHKVRSKKFRKGRVEHASFSAGVVLKENTKVGLTESIGKPKKHKNKKGTNGHLAHFRPAQLRR